MIPWGRYSASPKRQLHTLPSWLVVFNVPSTARSFRDGTPICFPLRRTWSSINTPFRPGFEPRAVAWQSITLPLRYASSTTLPRLLQSGAALPNSYPNACEPSREAVCNIFMTLPAREPTTFCMRVRHVDCA